MTIERVADHVVAETLLLMYHVKVTPEAGGGYLIEDGGLELKLSERELVDFADGLNAGMQQYWDSERKHEQWLQIRKDAASKIDAETAEVTWRYGQTGDPYGVIPDLPEEEQQVGRVYFARAAGSDIWVSFDDLPPEVATRLWELHKETLAFLMQAGQCHTGLKKVTQQPNFAQ